jgi:hypothetical protein
VFTDGVHVPRDTTNDWGDVVARLLDHLDAGTTDSAASPFTVAVADYLDADRWTLEVDRIARHPLSSP